MSPPLRLLLLLLLLGSAAVGASEALSLKIAEVQGEGWQLRGVTLTFDLSQPPQRPLTLQIEQLQWGDDPQHNPLATLAGVQLQCGDGTWRSDRLHCRDARLTLPQRSAAPLHAELLWDSLQQRGHLQLSGAPLGNGALELTLHLPAAAGGVELTLHGRNFPLNPLPPLLPADLAVAITQWVEQGSVAFRLALQQGSDGQQQLEGELEVQALHLNHQDTLFGEALSLQLDGHLSGSAQAPLHGQASLTLNSGALLTPYGYLDGSETSLRLQSALRLDRTPFAITLDPARLQLGNLAPLTLSAHYRPEEEPALRSLTLNITGLELAALYQNHLQPIYAGGLAGNLEVSGTLDLTLSQQGEERHYQLQLQQGELREPSGLFALTGLTLALTQPPHGPGNARLEWQQAHLLERIALGALEAHFQLSPAGLTLTQEITLPLFDGALVINHLIHQQAAIRFGGFLQPITLAAITRALDWPPLNGTLSGMIPLVHYRDGTITIEGVILAQLFDGDLLIEQLRIHDLFGPLPTLHGDIRIHNLNLETLTSAFAFGRITGRLDGHIQQLYLEGWEPISFDAALHTPPDYRGSRRISQRAVDNIANLGGSGISGALSRTILRVFDEFNYTRLGIRCRLQNGICEMGGIAPAEGGYYLVQGGGIPRIDIVGYNHRTDWNTLLERLQQIGSGGPPVIE